ncbi:MAG TPA: hypothetical protein VMF89_19820 [Polyangiales bacterium]|nr:hypothetical protein [Polyangiales bacterium]
MRPSTGAWRSCLRCSGYFGSAVSIDDELITVEPDNATARLRS